MKASIPTQEKQTSKRMPGKRRDWTRIKRDFFLSEHSQVMTFMKEIHGIDITKNGSAAKQVTGWTEEKADIGRQGLENAKKIIIELYSPKAEELADMHKNIINLAKAQIQWMMKQATKLNPETKLYEVVGSVDMKELHRLWEIVKAEKLEPTAVQKNETGFTQEDKDLLSSLLDINLDDDEE